MAHVILNDNIETARAVKIEVGLKIRCREDILEEIQNHPYIQENFTLNIWRLNRWWYSVYFDNKNE